LTDWSPDIAKLAALDDEEAREAIERELDQVRHFAALDHPNLVSIEDLGTVLGVPYVVMGYAGEDTLARILRRECLDPERALLYFVQACRGVLALHDRRLVHFDLKPSNVFIRGDVARVGDYGLSKMMVEGRLTLSFGRGTPHYMAPEILKSRADHRADIYSLGVILFESLTGRLPFPSPPPGSGGSGGVLPLREDDRPPEFPPEFPAPLPGGGRALPAARSHEALPRRGRVARGPRPDRASGRLVAVAPRRRAHGSRAAARLVGLERRWRLGQLAPTPLHGALLSATGTDSSPVVPRGWAPVQISQGDGHPQATGTPLTLIGCGEYAPRRREDVPEREALPFRICEATDSSPEGGFNVQGSGCFLGPVRLDLELRICERRTWVGSRRPRRAKFATLGCASTGQRTRRLSDCFPRAHPACCRWIHPLFHQSCWSHRASELLQHFLPRVRGTLRQHYE